VTPTIAELHLLTHRPEPMIAWWSALLGAPAQELNSRMTAIGGPTARVVIERSEIALDYHPEASGVTTIGVAPGAAAAVLEAVARLADLGSHPHRATDHGSHTCLWYLDPNGADVTVLAPACSPRNGEPSGLFPDELDPEAVLARARAAAQAALEVR
jgi:hypothetical protein